MKKAIFKIINIKRDSEKVSDHFILHQMMASNNFILHKLCLLRVNLIRKRENFRQLISFPNYGIRLCVCSRAMACYFGRRQGAQWAKLYYQRRQGKSKVIDILRGRASIVIKFNAFVILLYAKKRPIEVTRFHFEYFRIKSNIDTSCASAFHEK